MPGLKTNPTVQYDTTNFPAVARDLQRIEHDRAALFEEYRRLILLQDDAVGDDERRRFSEVVSILNIDTAQIARDAELIGKVRDFEKRATEHNELEAEAEKLQHELDKLPKDSPKRRPLENDLRTCEGRAASRSTARLEAGFLKRSKRGAILYGLTPIHGDDNRPLLPGEVRLG